jgi:hypothetical protein
MSERHQPLLRRLPWRIGRVLFWAGIAVIAAFGVVFMFANYPWFGVGVVLVTLLLVAHSERRRRLNQRASESARRRGRAQLDLSNELDPPTESHRDAVS